MSTKPDIKKQLEAIYGYELGEEAVQFINLFQPIASYSTSEGTTTQQNILVGGPKHCYLTRLLDVGGLASTGSDGKSQFRLTDFLCPAGEKFFPSVNVVATPLSSTPCFLTVVHSLLDNGADVEITVFTWDANGAAAPNVSFNWRCRVELLLSF
jgi:hypothetical protein